MLTTKGSIASRRRVLAGGAALAGALGAPAISEVAN